MTTDTPTVEQVAGWLLAIADDAALLPDAALTTPPPGRSTGRPVPSSRPPVRLDVLHLLDDRPKTVWDGLDPDRQGLWPTLHGWATNLAAAAQTLGVAEPRQVPACATITALCGWITEQLPWASQIAAWPAFATAVHQLHTQVRAATATVRPLEARPVPCRACGGPLQPRAGRSASWECGACRRVVTVQAVTLREAAPLVNVPRSTLQRWARRPGVLSPVTDGAKKLYDLGDIRRLVAEHRLRAVDV